MGDEYPYELVQRTVTLTRQKLGLHMALAEEFVESVGIEAASQYVSGQFALRLKATVLAEELPSYTDTDAATAWITYPDTWWDHFKHQYRDKWLMRWFVYRFPAKMKQRSSTVELETTWKNYATYPWNTHASTLPDTFGRYVPVTYIERRRTGGEQVDR